MPVDKPKSGETQEEYLKYCIPEEINGGMERDQAVAVCYSYWDKAEAMSAIKASMEFRQNHMKHSLIKTK
jgi:hypothetical protein